jgi:hypothetical protein
MTLRSQAAMLALSSLVVGSTAGAGLLDGAAPDFGGVPGKVVYRMGPVHYDPGWVDTMVTCTNLTSGPTKLALEIFDDQDNLIGGVTRADVAASGNVTFATSSGPEIASAVIVPNLSPIDHGKARVSAPTAQLSCTAMHHFRADDGTIKEAPLELIKKVAFGD